VSLKERGNNPEIEIKLEDFCLSAIKTVEEHLDAYRILNLASKPAFNGYTEFQMILDNF